MRDGIDPSYYQTLLPQWACRDRLFARETHAFRRPSFGRAPAEVCSLPSSWSPTPYSWGTGAFG